MLQREAFASLVHFRTVRAHGRARSARAASLDVWDHLGGGPARTRPPGETAQTSGFVDVTSFFTGSAGPLASGQWQILAQSDTPEPASLFLAGIGLVVGALCLRKRRVFRTNNFAGGTPVISLRQ